MKTTEHPKQLLTVRGAKEHNLKNIDVDIPLNSLVVITGLSGSGKSSLAFDTIYSEGQRRYLETFSNYIRQFMGGMERPDVEHIEGLCPVISIEQKTTNKNPRSTVGTLTEIYDFMRLLFAKLGKAYSYETGEEMISFTTNQILEMILTEYKDKKIALLAPVVKNRKGHYRELLENYKSQGFLQAMIDGEFRDLEANMKLDRYSNHDVDIQIDRVSITEDKRGRILTSLQLAFDVGEGAVKLYDYESGELRFMSTTLMCPTSGIAYPDPEPNHFSFNSPKGACPECRGLATRPKVEIDALIPDQTLSVKQGAIEFFKGKTSRWLDTQLEGIAHMHGFTLQTAWKDIPEEGQKALLYGESGTSNRMTEVGVMQRFNIKFDGVVSYVFEQYEQTESKKLQRAAEAFIVNAPCDACDGSGLKISSRNFKIGNKSIVDFAKMDIATLQLEVAKLPEHWEAKDHKIGLQIWQELVKRIGFLTDVGLEYLSLSRKVKTLSGGESQRIRLATQIGSQLEGVLYILDEPSIGLHQRDNAKLIRSIRSLCDKGNSVIVVEHDRDIMEKGDFILDMGPGAGLHGGEIIAQGTLDDIKKNSPVTGAYLEYTSFVPLSKERKGNGNTLSLHGCTGNNLQNVSIDIPLGTLTVVTGVSGSGKSSLINKTLYPILNKYFYRAVAEPLPYGSIENLEKLDKVVEVNQSPIGRTPRSNPATYTDIWTHIRSLYASLPEAKIRGYKQGRFSFNVKGGRCETCHGAGVETMEMSFLPDVYVDCNTCGGKRFNHETLEVRYKGKSIFDILEMSVEEAAEFFAPIPKISLKLQSLADVGLGYVKLGQSSTTLSGGEAQRVKLASELSKRDTGNTLYILDEPTTGLHFKDVHVLMDVLQRIVDKGNTVVVIEHNLDVIKNADHIIDIGPEGGKGGGKIVCVGTPREVSKFPESYTGTFLNIELQQHEKHQS